jgi:hypothetical protein
MIVRSLRSILPQRRPRARTLPYQGPHFLARPPGGREPVEVAGLTKEEAEELLDWLEANGCQHMELTLQTDERFAVRYR